MLLLMLTRNRFVESRESSFSKLNRILHNLLCEFHDVFAFFLKECVKFIEIMIVLHIEEILFDRHIERVSVGLYEKVKVLKDFHN